MPDRTAFRVADLDERNPTPFDLQPDSTALRGLADALGLRGLRKLRFTGEIAAEGQRDWLLTGHLGATVVQDCVVTLEPVTTRIETDVRRLYVADYHQPEEEESEMPEDDSQEPLASVIDPEAVMAEALALEIPPYPRKADAALGEAVFAEPGVEPLTDEASRPFAGLGGLRDALKKDD